ncbi:chromatin-remodeling ATPase INO80 [Nematocida sp. AWRm80]|nr:chromatin-remodeling ATPase INO80 [Nematocida sp. AWRm80]
MDYEDESIINYRIEIHKKIKKDRMIRMESRVRKLYENGKSTLQILGMDASRLPYPTMNMYVKKNDMEEIKNSIKIEKNEETKSTAIEEIDKTYSEICKKGIPKVHKIFVSIISVKQNQHKKISTVSQREFKRALGKTSKTNPILKGKRITKELQGFFKKAQRSTRERKKKEEKEDYERKKKEEEEKEEERQAKKLNFLITQTELFSHFILGKNAKLNELNELDEQSKIAMEAAQKHMKSLKDFSLNKPADGSSNTSTSKGMNIAGTHKRKRTSFQYTEDIKQSMHAQDSSGGLETETKETDHKSDVSDQKNDDNKNNPVYNNSILPISESVKVPSILNCTLKDYQKRGLEWLVSLYDQGINGMLADEMGLGKTVQSISFLAHLAENEGIWGPFLVITPASTLHNWEQEICKFVPAFKVIPYWGTVAERKQFRKHWQHRKLQNEDSPFHVVVTSYQLAVTDEKYFNRLKWQYMVLDEAQAIKSSNSARWKTLLSFKTRNRLLLTGTPIQNTLQELWALLHFIMPSLFDSHEEFSEWFRIEDGDSVNEAARLRMVLQPFMLRREKKDVADELGQKIEKTIICELTPKQKRLYESIRVRVPMASFLDNSLPDDIEGVEGLMNLVMQFRKVCNHPDLFEKKETSSGWCQPPTRIYIPNILGDMAFGKRKTWVDKLLSCDINTQSNPNSPAARLSRSFQGQSTNSLDIELLHKRTKLDPSLDNEQIRVLQTANTPSCMPARQEIVSPAVVPEPYRPQAFYDLNSHLKSPSIYIPTMERFVSDSGKLLVLETLLPKLKQEGHRVLIYFQMTRMIDLFEEYLTVRNYSYLRLDGSSKISNRKELVKDWQSNADRFIFLLSTRAGGLGINLTAADTVIFYDSDWNPTVDQQAMDRAHRLGQTKQVTVYRLITANTIEERIMEKAGIKGEIQRMVIKTRD